MFNKEADIHGLFKRYSAFTLAEVLVTLGIIGIVAAMTIPNVMKNFQTAQFRSKWKKEFSLLQQVILQIYAEENVKPADIVPSWQYMGRYFCRMQDRLKVASSTLNCPANPDTIPIDSLVPFWTKRSLWAADNAWQKANGTKMDLSTNSYYKDYLTFQLNDGAVVMYNCSTQFLVDVNGKEKPNIIGQDIYGAAFNRTGVDSTLLFPFGSPKLGSIGCPDCQGATYRDIVNKDNYAQDCKTGSGWGCSCVAIEGK